jgi:hypothetical protein
MLCAFLDSSHGRSVGIRSQIQRQKVGDYSEGAEGRDDHEGVHQDHQQVKQQGDPESTQTRLMAISPFKRLPIAWGPGQGGVPEVRVIRQWIHPMTATTPIIVIAQGWPCWL